MSDEIDVYIQLGSEDHQVGSLHRQPRKGYEAVGFQYASAWLVTRTPFPYSQRFVWIRPRSHRDKGKHCSAH